MGIKGTRRSLLQIYPRHLEAPLLVVVSAALLAKGLSLPVLTIKQMFWSKNTFSVLSGIDVLFQDKHMALGCLIFFFSIIFPISKLFTVLFIWFVPLATTQRKFILSVIEMLGKWSMLDVYVVAIVVVAIKFGSVTSAKPEIGIYVFGASVLLSMLVTLWVGRLAEKAPTVL